jgi:hypothetical protein
MAARSGTESFDPNVIDPRVEAQGENGKGLGRVI